jgi:hypothetical protein
LPFAVLHRRRPRTSNRRLRRSDRFPSGARYSIGWFPAFLNHEKQKKFHVSERGLRSGRAEIIRSEKRSGTTTAGSEQLQNILDFLREGDVLMVTRIDRLARSIGGTSKTSFAP